MLVIIDPGHGGDKPGAVWNDPETVQKDDLLESDVNLMLAVTLKSVVLIPSELTRVSSTTVSLSERVQHAVKVKADMLVSIHCDSTTRTDDTAHGITVCVNPRDPKAMDLAKCIEGALVRRSFDYRRIMPRSDLYLLNNLSEKVPAILVECGFINNEGDRTKLLDASYQRKLAEALSAGMMEFMDDTMNVFG